MVAALASAFASTFASLCASDSAPYAKTIFANERLRVIDERLAPGMSANLSIPFPSVRWRVLGAGAPLPTPRFFPAGACVSVHNDEPNTERSDLVFQVLQPPRYSAKQFEALLAAPTFTTVVGSNMWLENEYVRMWDFHSPVGMETFHQHVLDYAFVVLGNGSALNLFKPDADARNGSEYVASFGFSDRQVSWSEVAHGGFKPDGKTPDAPGALHSVDTRGFDHPFREYLIELK